MRGAWNCKLCGGGELERLYTHQSGLPLLACRNCGLLFFPSAPGKEREYWSTGGSRHNVEVYTDPAVLRLDRVRFTRYLRLIDAESPRGKLLDYGCGVGTFLKCARDRGWEAYGLDISERAVSHARACGLPVWTLEEHLRGEAPTAQPSAFDVVTMWDVLEHVEDPHGTLQLVASLLKEGGVLFLETPTVDYPLRRWSLRIARLTQGRLDWARFLFYPDHALYFSERTLSQLLQAHGFRVMWVRRVTTSPQKVMHKLRLVHRSGMWLSTAAWLILRLTQILGGNKLLVCARKDQPIKAHSQGS
jgi:2-polyprenyl-3-methyl-5-hydroxy-6-metoxy-1,4-benzoquinol methylase